MVTFAQSIKLAYQQSFNVTGKSTRAEYWWFVLFQILASFVISAIAAALPAAAILSIAFSVINFPASISIVFRRVRDAKGLILWPLLFYGGSFAFLGYLLAVAPGLLSAGQAASTPEFSNLLIFPLLVWLLSGVATFIYLFVPSRD